MSPRHAALRRSASCSWGWSCTALEPTLPTCMHAVVAEQYLHTSLSSRWTSVAAPSSPPSPLAPNYALSVIVLDRCYSTSLCCRIALPHVSHRVMHLLFFAPQLCHLLSARTCYIAVLVTHYAILGIPERPEPFSRACTHFVVSIVCSFHSYLTIPPGPKYDNTDPMIFFSM